MLPMVKSVLIVGGGIGGLCLAVALRDRGIDVEIVEIKREWTVYGVGIIQQSNVVRAMAQLGLVNRYLAAAFPFENVGIYNPFDGQRVALIPGKRLAGPEYPANLGISRPALHNILTSAARERGTQVRLGVTVDHLDQTDDDVEVWFSDRTKGRFDLVVGADGIYSRVRTMVFGEQFQPRFTGQSVWRHNFARRPEIDHLAAFNGPNGSAGLVPLSQTLMYMYLTSSEPGNPRMPEDQLHNLMRQRLARFGGPIGELRDTITDPGDIVYKPMEVIFMPDPWFKGRVLLIGDAAHSTTPHLGQGAGMAIEDAVVLGEELMRSGTLDDQLTCFMQRRFPRCEYIVRASESVGEMQMRGAKPGAEMAIVQEMLEVTAQPI
jgi:2-polyprenyl-6-methoxyphenol hydroxylase-like FAD-dependent oxidoreductase